MFVIRKHQMEALARSQEERFRQEMVDHVKTYFPEARARMNDAALHRHVAEVLDKASTFELTSRRDLCRFLNLTMVCGKDFDTARKTRWIHDKIMSCPVDERGLLISKIYLDLIPSEGS